MIVFFRYPTKMDHQATTVAVEGLILFLDSPDDFQELYEELPKYGQVPVRVIVSDFDATEYADKIDGKWHKKGEAKELKDLMNKLDMLEFKKIKKSFETYDKDGSGTIDNDEMLKIAVSMGEDTESEDFKKSMHALDLNHDGDISFQEFISWWKIGRQNTKALPKIYDLYNAARETIDKFFEYDNFVKDIKAINEGKHKETVSSQRVLFRSPGKYELKTFLEFAMAVGGSKRSEMAINFLKQFTSNTSGAKTNWISILIPISDKQKRFDTAKARDYIEQFKENCLTNFTPG